MLQSLSSNSRSLLKVIGIILLSISAFYTVYSVRTGAAQVIYIQAKNTQTVHNAFVAEKDDIFRQCQKAQRLYPYNHLLLSWGAEEAFARSETSTGAEKVYYIDLADKLCDRGLALNPYLMPLPFIKTKLLCMRSIDDATTYWETYVEWDYWNSYNHAVLSGLYAADGKFGQAISSLQLIKGTEDYAAADKVLQNYWKADAAAPPR